MCWTKPKKRYVLPAGSVPNTSSRMFTSFIEHSCFVSKKAKEEGRKLPTTMKSFYLDMTAILVSFQSFQFIPGIIFRVVRVRLSRRTKFQSNVPPPLLFDGRHHSAVSFWIGSLHLDVYTRVYSFVYKKRAGARPTSVGWFASFLVDKLTLISFLFWRFSFKFHFLWLLSAKITLQCSQPVASYIAKKAKDANWWWAIYPWENLEGIVNRSLG